MMQIALSENTLGISSTSPRQAGINPISPEARGGLMIERSGMYVSSCARARSASAIASAHASGGSAATTSSWDRISIFRRASRSRRPRFAGARVEEVDRDITQRNRTVGPDVPGVLEVQAGPLIGADHVGMHRADHVFAKLHVDRVADPGMLDHRHPDRV